MTNDTIWWVTQRERETAAEVFNQYDMSDSELEGAWVLFEHTASHASGQFDAYVVAHRVAAEQTR